jgi:transcriptional regulator with XRE-family HTH domain
LSRELVASWAETLRLERLRQRLKQSDVAEMIGTDQPQISHWEAGHTQPQSAHLILWAGALGYRIEMLALREPNPSQKGLP